MWSGSRAASHASGAEHSPHPRGWARQQVAGRTRCSHRLRRCRSCCCCRCCCCCCLAKRRRWPASSACPAARRPHPLAPAVSAGQRWASRRRTRPAARAILQRGRRLSACLCTAAAASARCAGPHSTAEPRARAPPHLACAKQPRILCVFPSTRRPHWACGLLPSRGQSGIDLRRVETPQSANKHTHSKRRKGVV